MTVITRRGADPGDVTYDVLVGHGARRELASLLPRTARRAAIVTQAGVPLELDPGAPVRALRDRRRRGAQDAGDDRGAVPRLRPDGPHPQRRGHRRRRRHRHRRRRVRRRGVAPRRARRARHHHAARAWSTRRSAARPAVNLPEGKNLVGAIWQPSGVICDLDALATLPPRQWRCGRGEMAKYHFLTGDDLLALDEPERIARCVEIKAEVVAGDEREDRTAAPGAAQLRPHAGPRAGDRHRPRARARRGRRHRPDLRRPPGPAARPHRRRRGAAPLRRRRRRLRAGHGAARRRRPRRARRADGPGQEGGRLADVRPRRPRGVEVVKDVDPAAARQPWS